MSALAPTLQAFFADRLISQRNASPRTVAAYRDTLRLLLRFAQHKTGKQPCQLDFSDLDAPLIGAFLDHLEDERGNTPRTRNARLAAIHSLYRYAALRHPEHAQTIARVIEIPPKHYERALISYLDEQEIKALLRAPDRSSWLGRRDHALLLLAIQTDLDPTQALRARAHLLPRRAGDQSAPQSAGSQQLARPTRSRATAPRDPNRPARHRAHKPAHRRRRPRSEERRVG